MIVNFEIEDNYAVNYQGRHIDLHNNFELVSINNLNDQIDIEFIQSKGDWIDENELKGLLFEFKGITFKYEQEGEAASTDWKTLGELTYFPSDMRDVNDSIVPQKIPKDDDDITFFFESGKSIRINCKEIELKIDR